MLIRYWQWTSGPAAAAESSVPFGPLRLRQWTNGPATATETGLPFGPLRFRAWTSGATMPPIDQGGGGAWKPTIPRLRQRSRQRQEEEILLAVIAAALNTIN